MNYKQIAKKISYYTLVIILFAIIVIILYELITNGISGL